MDQDQVASAHQLPLRYSLRSLLVVLGGICIVLTPTYWFGGLYLLSIGLSVGLVVYCSRKYCRSAGSAIAVATIGLFLGLFLATVAFCIHAFFNLLLCIALAVARARPKVFRTSLAALLVAVYGVVIWSGTAEVRRLTELKAELPFKSLAQRLAFENSSLPETSPDNSIELASAVASNLEEQDEELAARFYRRSWALRQVHENTRTQFAGAAGFGPARMPLLANARIELEPRPQLKMPVALSVEMANLPDSSNRLHRDVVMSFVKPERMGYARSRDEVTGFEPHEVSAWNDEKGESNGSSNWQVVRLELVSLLRQAEPRVYVAEIMPRMDELANVEHRRLNDFEKSALPKLATQEDVVFDQQPERIQMLGAVRAGKTCLECHEGQRGKLLGAFSYEIVPVSDADKTTADIR